METPNVDHTPRTGATAQRQAAAGPLGLFDQILRNQDEGGSVSTEPTAVRPTKDRGAPAERPEEKPTEADQPELPEAAADSAALAAPEAPPQEPEAAPQKRLVQATAAAAQTKSVASGATVAPQQPLPAGQAGQAGQPDLQETATAGQTDATRKAPQADKVGGAAAASAKAPSTAKSPAEILGQSAQPQAGGALKVTPDPRQAVQTAANAQAGAATQASTANRAARAVGPKPTAGNNTAPTAIKPTGQRGAASAAAKAAPGPNGAERGGLAPETFAALSLEAQQGRPGDPAATDLQTINSLRPAGGLSGAPVGGADLAGLARASAEGRATPAQQVAVQIKRAVAAGNDRINIRLHPAELGRVQVRLDVADDGHVRALVTAERAETLDLMQRDPRGLERALQEAGLKTDSGSLSFNLRDQGEGAAGAEGDGNTEPSAEGQAAQPDEAAADADTLLYWTGGEGRLDIRV